MAANDKNMEADKKVSVDGDEIELENEDNHPIDQTKKFESSIAFTSEEAVEYKQLEKETQQQHMPHDLFLEQNSPRLVPASFEMSNKRLSRSVTKSRPADETILIELYSAMSNMRQRAGPTKRRLRDQETKDEEDEKSEEDREEEEEVDNGRLSSSASPFKRMKTEPHRPKAGPHPELESNKKKNFLKKLQSRLLDFSKFARPLKNKTTSEELEDF